MEVIKGSYSTVTMTYSHYNIDVILLQLHLRVHVALLQRS
jgi:hypothetical protein